jgi:hypothetical protein
MTMKEYWHKHGTKLIGFVSSAIGVVELIDSTTWQVIERLLGPQLGKVVSNGVLILSGVMTAYRGFRNSAQRADVLPPPQPRTPPTGGTGS